MLSLGTALFALPACKIPLLPSNGDGGQGSEPGVSTGIVPPNASGGQQANTPNAVVNILVVGEPIDSSVTSQSAGAMVVTDKHGFYLGISDPDALPFALPHAID